jgi:Tfp pilus assembly protein PilV
MRCLNAAAGSCSLRAVGARTGATLSEVLIAILVMSIGVLSVAALFPISIIRSAQANQLTVATGLRYNVEQMLAVYPQLWMDPDGGDADSDGDRFNDQRGRNFIIDPLGYYYVQPVNSSQADVFGFNTTANPIVPGGQVPWYNSNVRRYQANIAPAGVTAPALLDPVAASPDSWTLRFEDLAVGSTSNSVTLLQLPNAGFPVPVPVPYGFNNPYTRLVLFDTTGQFSEVRPLTSINGTIASWDEPDTNGNNVLDIAEDFDGNGLRAGAVPFTVGDVRIETQERRFSWLITARQDSSGVTDLDMAVFFKRSQLSTEEFTYSNGTAANSVVFMSGSNTATFQYNTGSGDPSPFLKKGGFVFDATNCYWYQIQNYTDNSGTVVLKLDRSAVSNSNTAMLFRGIVDVFFIGSVQ